MAPVDSQNHMVCLGSPMFRWLVIEIYSIPGVCREAPLVCRDLLEDSSKVLGSLVSVDRGGDGLYILVLNVGHESLEGRCRGRGYLLSLSLSLGFLLSGVGFLSLVLLEGGEGRDGSWVGG